MDELYKLWSSLYYLLAMPVEIQQEIQNNCFCMIHFKSFTVVWNENLNNGRNCIFLRRAKSLTFLCLSLDTKISNFSGFISPRENLLENTIFTTRHFICILDTPNCRNIKNIYIYFSLGHSKRTMLYLPFIFCDAPSVIFEINRIHNFLVVIVPGGTVVFTISCHY
jgi:hypothetical protein